MTPSAMREHGVGPGPVAAHLTGRPAAEHLPADEHVGEGVDVGGPQAVDVEGQVVAGRLVAGDPVGVAGVARGQHVVLDGMRMFGERLGGQIVGQADRLPGADQADGGRAAGVGQMVEGARAGRRRPNGPSS